MTQDSEQRRRAIEETDKSFVVEASAGTGKTSTLIDRILHLVLKSGPRGKPIPLSSICAITFTEKAAGEMKIRLRQKLEDAAQEQGDLGQRAQEALKDLETASISTFHAFAVALLKERPIEAGLDPGFEALDEMQAELLFREIWEPWLDQALARREPALERALRGGIRLETIQNLARIVRSHPQDVRELRLIPPLSEEEIGHQGSELLKRGRALSREVKDPADKLARYLESALLWLEDKTRSADEPEKPGSAGAATKWNGGKETVQIAQRFVREVVEFSAACKRLPAQRVFAALVGWMIEDFLPEWENAKRSRGVLDFDDQLQMARDLLKKSRSARSDFQRRYATLLVDEFQDTDRIQLDLVLLLSSTNLDEIAPVRLRPDPGRLFIVGDPKQSIYRFRRADIETYLEIVHPSRREALGLEQLQLTANFRSVPTILRFVDGVFGDLMKMPDDGNYQPDYLHFGDEGKRRALSPRPAACMLGDQESSGSASQRVQEYFGREALRVVKLIRRVTSGESWIVSDPLGGELRPARFGDIAVLMPVLTHADILEDKLREAGVPYVLEGGKFYYTRNEVSSAITVLRSVSNPNDAVALYGALRSIFFGLSDEELLRAHMQNLPLDYRKEVPEDSPLNFSFDILRDLHRRRHQRPASETFEVLLSRTGAREVMATRGLQALANLSKLARTLRTLQRDMTYSQVVELLSSLDEEGVAEPESRLMEERSDAVRILSIHRAKGLDFPIVFLVGLGLTRLNATSNFLADPHRTRTFAISAGSEDSGLRTPGWKELAAAEKEREDAELIRLLYVAMTRARDYLIVCAHTAKWKQIPGGDRMLPYVEGTRLRPLLTTLIRCLSNENLDVQWIDTRALDQEEIEGSEAIPPAPKDWAAAFNRKNAELMRLLKETPLSKEMCAAAQGRQAESSNEDTSMDGARQTGQTRAVRLGIAFHEAMEKADVFHRNRISDEAKAVAVRHKLDEGNTRTLEAMIRQCRRSEVLERARSAAISGRRMLRELPFVRPVSSANGTVMEEGKIDLLFEEEEGWVLVDYKTDQVSGDDEELEITLREKYAGQIQEYASALAALGVKLKAAYLLMARTGHTIEMGVAL